MPFPTTNPSFQRTILNPLRAKPLAKELIQDPKVMEHNTKIYMLTAIHTFGSAVQEYITLLSETSDLNEASVYAGACFHILVLYSLMRMRYEWFEAWCSWGHVREAAGCLVLGGSRHHDNNNTTANEHVAARVVGQHKVSGSWQQHRKILVDYFRTTSRELRLDRIRFEGFRPRQLGQSGTREREEGFVNRLDAERDWVLGEACVLVLCPTVHP
ncbi:MAG: hypothetical protein Q9221_006795 [Calogaya cf. arnoldii]